MGLAGVWAGSGWVWVDLGAFGTSPAGLPFAHQGHSVHPRHRLVSLLALAHETHYVQHLHECQHTSILWPELPTERHINRQSASLIIFAVSSELAPVDVEVFQISTSSKKSQGKHPAQTKYKLWRTWHVAWQYQRRGRSGWSSALRTLASTSPGCSGGTLHRSPTGPAAPSELSQASRCQKAPKSAPLVSWRPASSLQLLKPAQPAVCQASRARCWRPSRSIERTPHGKRLAHPSSSLATCDGLQRTLHRSAPVGGGCKQCPSFRSTF